MDIKIQPIQNIQQFMEIVNDCSEDVLLISKDNDSINLKGHLSQYIASTDLLTSHHINEFVLSVNNPDDAKKLIGYFDKATMI